MDIQTILVMDVSERDESKRDTKGEDWLNNLVDQKDFKLNIPPVLIIC